MVNIFHVIKIFIRGDLDEMFCSFSFYGQGEGTDVTANSVHPGPIATNLFRQSSLLSGIYFDHVMLLVAKMVRISTIHLLIIWILLGTSCSYHQ